MDCTVELYSYWNYFFGVIMTVNNVKYVIPLLTLLLISVGMSNVFAQG